MKNKVDILQDSCKYFYQHGFNGTSVDNLAKNANVTKKTLYRYFDSKEALIGDSLDFRHEWFMTKLQAALHNLVGIAIIDGYLQFLKNWLTDENFFGCMFINACGEFSDKTHPLHQKALVHKKQVIEFLRLKILADNIDTEQGQKLANLLFINGEGLIVAMQVGILNTANIDEFITHISNQFVSQ